MWLGIGYLVPMKGDKSGGGAIPDTFYILTESGTITEMQTEDSTSLMVQEVDP